MYGGIDGLADAILSVCDGRLSPRLGIGAGKFSGPLRRGGGADAGGWLRVPEDAAAWLAPLPVSWLPLERERRGLGWPASASPPWATWRHCPRESLTEFPGAGWT